MPNPSNKPSTPLALDLTSIIQRSPPTLCSYLPNQISQLNYISLSGDQTIRQDVYSELCQRGFRRSGNAFYQPNCPHCQQCIATRVLVADFQPSRRFRRVLKRNRHVSQTSITPAQVTAEHYGLYQRYISARHADGDMYPPSLHTFEQFLVASSANTVFIEFREANNKLIAVAVTDILDNGLSSVYTFFEPDNEYDHRSLGVFCILKQIETAKLLGLAYLYLGFWIASVKKMAYKTDYSPMQLFIGDAWQRFEHHPTQANISISAKQQTHRSIKCDNL